MLRTTALISVLTMMVVLGPTAARAGDMVVCPTSGKTCYVVAETPGDPVDQGAPLGSGDTTAEVTARCRDTATDTVVACSDPDFGWWSNNDSCYYRAVDPQPPASEPAWQGHYGSGAIYIATCPLPGAGTGGGWVWRAAAPEGYGGVAPTPGQLAARAVSQLPLRGPKIGMAPGSGMTGLVGLPVWMWTAANQQTWGPLSATAAVPGLSVTATARAVKVVWDMGDGGTVTCDGPGTPYTRAAGASASPTCGYRYERSSASQPGVSYTVTATTTWEIGWSGGGASGQLTQTRSSSALVRIGELQVLVS